MTKNINLKDTVYDICTAYPEVKQILISLGFREIAGPLALNTAGKMMSIPQGAAIRGIELAKVVQALQSAGFEITDPEFSQNLSSHDASQSQQPDPSAEDPQKREELLKEYVRRLSRGDSLAEVRKDFVANFHSVDAGEIAQAEQDLIMSGTPIADVQKLCDVHSALFHGATREEQIANAEKAVQDSVENTQQNVDSQPLKQIAGHPYNVLTAENNVISQLLQAARAAQAAKDDAALKNRLDDLRTATVHYAKKGDLIYPILKTKYGVSGPADVMWGVDDEIRDELKILTETGPALLHFAKRADEVLTRAEEMVYKENSILFPLCLQHFSEEDWMRIAYELPAYDGVPFASAPVWPAAQAKREQLQAAQKAGMTGSSAAEGLIPLGSGHMTPAQIEAVLNTIPMELSFIDDQNINRYFNAGPKLFKRSDTAIDREVFNCHPPRYAEMARQIIERLKTGTQDSVDVWMNKHGVPVLVRYMAVRDSKGNYVGTLECVQKMAFAKKHFS